MQLPRTLPVPTAPVVALGLAGGFAAAQATGARPLGGVLMAGANAVAAHDWYARGGWPMVAGLSAVFWGAMGVSHPLAHKIGAWPSVAVVSAASAAVAYLASDRKR